jgi:acetyl-CoA carboxylase carboxyltransferase component
MFGFNAGGGSYLPRQGSFLIQPKDTFFGLTGPGVVKSVLGEDITPEDLGGPKVHCASGVTDLTVADETAALRTAVRLISYLPDNNFSMAPFQETSDPLDRKTWEINTLLKKAFNSPTGFNTPFDVSIIIQQICDHGDYFELQPDRSREAITALGRLGGNVVGFVANNSAVSSGQIDCDSAVKIARFVRFCNIYNIPLIFMEDTTGFLPGRDQEARGIVQAGRSMLDSIIDVRTPRILLILRNAYGGAYASYNNYPIWCWLCQPHVWPLWDPPARSLSTRANCARCAVASKRWLRQEPRNASKPAWTESMPRRTPKPKQPNG